MRLTRILLLLILMVTGIAHARAAEETRVFENQYGRVEVPVAPHCVVSLHDYSITIQLLELGIKPCGSTGRKKLWQDPYFRGAEHRFDMSGVSYIGSHKAPDEEAIAALKPDLIIGLSYHQALKEKLSHIAPVVILPTDELPIKEWAAQLAEVVGRQAQYQNQLKEYNWILSEFKRLVPEPEKITVTTLEMYQDSIYLIARGGLGEVIKDMGLGRPAVYQSVKEGMEYSLERLKDFDADFIIDTYEPMFNSREETKPIRQSRQWQDLFAVKHDQFLYFNRSRFGESMGGLIGSGYLLLTHIGERGMHLRSDEQQ
ncbi:ABC transporter substrate-binding protein [Gynuella sunshinyii]|uniref:ABC-type Fe3+-hydroxamate transport system, periplasmic component n=1 Tax=Gynuella sunshinyii YC6258 TaxID=1445510 RepID=A0A0C5VQ64_9GAMM|nr:ABC transporter substrate-binding protein [Gynuella sunshinyii]AJQ95573.1 ABC-type Fe3+-hydroxamate transport system, periplasmic component [Gynuella sunshinyii YC6258]